MKLKGMVSLCKRDRRVVIFDRYRDDGTIEQFLSDGHGIYPAGDLPPLDVKTILSVFDISTEQEAKWDVDRAEAPGWLDTSDFGNDTPLHNSRVLVNYQGDVYLPLVSDAQEVFWVDCAAHGGCVLSDDRGQTRHVLRGGAGKRLAAGCGKG